MTGASVGHDLDVVIIGGFGHVGLPLGIALADAGANVGLYDVDDERRAAILSSRMPFIEHDAEPILRRVLNRTLHVVDDLSALARASVALITIGTPVDEYLNPEFEVMLEIAAQMSAH